MRLIKFSIAAVSLTTLFLSAVVANAVLTPMPAKIGVDNDRHGQLSGDRSNRLRPSHVQRDDHRLDFLP
jgi:hypothetical protein